MVRYRRDGVRPQPEAAVDVLRMTGTALRSFGVSYWKDHWMWRIRTPRGRNPGGRYGISNQLSRSSWMDDIEAGANVARELFRVF